MPLNRIAILVPGEMGAAVGKAFGDNGIEIITCLVGRSDYTKKLALRANMRDAGSLDALVREADLVLSTLDPAKAVTASGEIATAMQPADPTPA